MDKKRGVKAPKAVPSRRQKKEDAEDVVNVRGPPTAFLHGSQLSRSTPTTVCALLLCSRPSEADLPLQDGVPDDIALLGVRLLRHFTSAVIEDIRRTRGSKPVSQHTACIQLSPFVGSCDACRTPRARMPSSARSRLVFSTPRRQEPPAVFASSVRASVCCTVHAGLARTAEGEIVAEITYLLLKTRSHTGAERPAKGYFPVSTWTSSAFLAHLLPHDLNAFRAPLPPGQPQVS